MKYQPEIAKNSNHPPSQFLTKSFSSKDRLSPLFMTHYDGHEGLCTSPRAAACGSFHCPGPERLLFMNCLFTKQVHHCQRHRTEVRSGSGHSERAGTGQHSSHFMTHNSVNSRAPPLNSKVTPTEQGNVSTWSSTGLRLTPTHR